MLLSLAMSWSSLCSSRSEAATPTPKPTYPPNKQSDRRAVEFPILFDGTPIPDEQCYGINFSGGTKTVTRYSVQGKSEMRCEVSLTSSGGGGGSIHYCGKTTTTYDGSQGGYTGADTKCAAAFNNCHLCSSEEIHQLIAAGNQPALGDGWTFHGPPGYQTFITSDCLGLTTNSAPGFYGRQWRFGVNATGGRGTLITCNSHLPDHCCK